MTESLVKLRMLLGPKIPQDFWSAEQIVLESQNLRTTLNGGLKYSARLINACVQELRINKPPKIRDVI